MNKQNGYFRWLLVALLVFIQAAIYSQDQQQPGKPVFRIVQISDTQPVPGSEEHWVSVQKAIDLVNSLSPDLVLMPGDVTHSGTEDEFKGMKALLDQIKAPLYVIPGNHDLIFHADETEKTVAAVELHKRKIELYRKYFGPEQWTLEVGDFLFVGNDCTVDWPDVSPERAAWLTEAFSKSDKPYKFIVTHYHPDPKKAHATLDPMLTSLGVLGYMHGHNHRIQAYEHPESGRLIFSSGSAHYGVMYFDIYDNYMVCFWQPRDGCAIPKGIYDLKQVASKVKFPPPQDVIRRETAADAASDNYTVACYYFPNWGPVDDSEWQVLEDAKPKFEGHQQPKIPLWGIQNERDPKVMAQKIDAAADHGIDCFIFDWYWWDNCDRYLGKALEEGFLKAANNNRIQFSIM